MKALFHSICLLSLLLFAMACDDGNYTNSSVHGIVIDATDNSLLEGVLVTNETTGQNCITKADGKYEFNDLLCNKLYTIRAQKDGYISSPYSILPSEVGDVLELNIKLTRRP